MSTPERLQGPAHDPRCACGARVRTGNLKPCDSNGWPVYASQVAEPGRPGYRPGERLWDGVRVVCIVCGRISYDTSGGESRAFVMGQAVMGQPDDPPSRRGDPEQSQERREQHEPGARAGLRAAIGDVARALRRRRP